MTFCFLILIGFLHSCGEEENKEEKRNENASNNNSNNSKSKGHL